MVAKPKPIDTIADLTPDARNPRKRGQRAAGMLVNSLHEVGAARSIVIDEAGNILAGNGTVEAAAEAGIERVQVVDVDGETLVAVRRSGLTAKQKRRLAILDNRTGELAEWDVGVLAEIAQAGVEIDDLWSTDELTTMLAGMEHGDGGLLPGADADAIPDDAPTRCKTGDLWRLGDHRLLCGDCTDAASVARLMAGEKAQAVVTDPPYGINRAGVTNDDPEGLRALFSGCLRCVPSTDAAVIAFQSPRLFPVWLDAIRAAGHQFERMLWMYKENDCTFPWRGWLLKSEAILVSSVGTPDWPARFPEPYAHDCYRLNWCADTKVDIPGWHASIKPFTCVLDLVGRTRGLVYDPFLGSGTTLIAAEQLGRRCYGIEIEPRYSDVVLARWEAATGKTAERVDG